MYDLVLQNTILHIKANQFHFVPRSVSSTNVYVDGHNCGALLFFKGGGISIVFYQMNSVLNCVLLNYVLRHLF